MFRRGTAREKKRRMGQINEIKYKLKKMSRTCRNPRLNDDDKDPLIQAGRRFRGLGKVIGFICYPPSLVFKEIPLVLILYHYKMWYLCILLYCFISCGQGCVAED